MCVCICVIGKMSVCAVHAPHPIPVREGCGTLDGKVESCTAGITSLHVCQSLEPVQEPVQELVQEQEAEVKAIMEHIHEAVELNNRCTKEQYLSHYRAKESEILTGRTLRSWCREDGAAMKTLPPVATDADLMQRWISEAPRVCAKLTAGLVKPGSMQLSSLSTWNTFLKSVFKRVAGKDTARHMQAHLIRVQRLLERRLRAEVLDREVQDQISSFAPDDAVSSEVNAARSWEATMLNSQRKRNERETIQRLEDSCLEPLMKTLFDFLCRTVVPEHYEEYMLMCVMVNQWLCASGFCAPANKNSGYRIVKVHTVRSDDPYQAFHWEHAPDILELTLDSKHHRWFWCTIVCARSRETRQCWVPNVVQSIGGALLEQTTALMENVARRQLDRELQLSPIRYFFEDYVHLSFISTALLDSIRKVITVAPSPLPMPAQRPRDPMVLRMLLHTFVCSWLTLDAEEQDAQLQRTDEPDVDHSEWFRYVSSKTRNRH